MSCLLLYLSLFLDQYLNVFWFVHFSFCDSSDFVKSDFCYSFASTNRYFTVPCFFTFIDMYLLLIFFLVLRHNLESFKPKHLIWHSFSENLNQSDVLWLSLIHIYAAPLFLLANLFQIFHKITF